MTTLSITEAAARAGTTYQAVWNAIERHRLYAYRELGVAGGRWLIALDAFVAWRANRLLTASTRDQIVRRILREDHQMKAKMKAKATFQRVAGVAKPRTVSTGTTSRPARDIGEKSGATGNQKGGGLIPKVISTVLPKGTVLPKPVPLSELTSNKQKDA